MGILIGNPTDPIPTLDILHPDWRWYSVRVGNATDEVLSDILVLFVRRSQPGLIVPVVARRLRPGEAKVVYLCPAGDLDRYAAAAFARSKSVARIPSAGAFVSLGSNRPDVLQTTWAIGRGESDHEPFNG